MGPLKASKTDRDISQELAALRARVAELERLSVEREQDLLTETLVEVILALTSQTSHTAVLDQILHQAHRLVPCTTSNIVLLEGDTLRVAHWRNGYQAFGSEGLISSLAQPLAEYPLDAEVVRSRKPLIVSDTHQEPRWVVMHTTAWIRSSVVVPICQHDRVFGLLRLDSDTPGQFTAQDAEYLLPLASAAAVALENARLFEETQRRNRELALLNRVIAAASTTLEPHRVLEITCRELALAFEVPQAAAALLNEKRTASVVVAEYLGKGRPSAMGAVIPLQGNPTAQYVLERKAPLVVADAQHDPRMAAVHDLMCQRGTVSLLILPLVVRGQVLGTIGLDAIERREFSDDEIDLAASAAAAAARALENARLYEQAHQEIAERNRTREELRRLIDFNAGIVQNMAEGIIMQDTEARFTFVNPAAADMLGYALAELMGLHWTAVVPPDQRSIVQAADERRQRGEVDRYELQLVRKDGTRLPVLVGGSPRFEQGRFVGTLAVFTDISELTRAEEEKRVLQEKLARAQRMESLGVLAGGVAHELNNILGPLVAYPDLIMMDLPEESPIRDDVLRIKQSAERAAAVVQDLLTLARRGVYRMIPLNLNTIVEDYGHSPSFTELTAKNPYVHVDMDLSADLLNVSGSVPHLYKVVMNLVLNAFEAMPHGGRLKVATECVSLDRPIPGYDYVEAGDYVVLRVSDTGVGIEERDLSRIFEPFYTKKEMGRSGSGLGLAVVYGVVHDHKGRIDVQTEVGQGTDFIIYLPVTRETPEEEEDAKADYSGNETILIVDDLAEQRELAIKLLSSLGYRVEAAASGHEAVEYLAANDVDILVLDMIMEDDFDGLDTYREIVKMRPGQKAVIASGFSETARVKEAQRLGAGPFVKKPYTLEGIGRAVHQELRRR